MELGDGSDLFDHGPGPPPAQAPLAFPIVNRFCVAGLYDRAGRLTTETGGSRPRRAVSKHGCVDEARARRWLQQVPRRGCGGQ
jgi:hypothetical protein